MYLTMENLKELPRREDDDVLELSKRLQVLVAGNEKTGVARDCGREHEVILFICGNTAHGGYWHNQDRFVV
jgi:hypothetical protein